MIMSSAAHSFRAALFPHHSSSHHPSTPPAAIRAALDDAASAIPPCRCPHPRPPAAFVNPAFLPADIGLPPRHADSQQRLRAQRSPPTNGSCSRVRDDAQPPHVLHVARTRTAVCKAQPEKDKRKEVVACACRVAAHLSSMTATTTSTTTRSTLLLLAQTLHDCNE